MQAKASKILRAVVVIWISAANVFAAESALSADETKVLEQVRASALAYSHSLPDFICMQITQRETSSFGEGDAFSEIEEQLTFFGQKENYEVLKVNGKKTAGRKHAQLRGMISAGEFGSAQQEIFDPRSHAEFAGDGMAKVRGRRAYVFGFRVPKEHGATVMLRVPKEQITVSYGGQVFVDAENLSVLRIKSALDLPVSSGLQKGESSVEYGPVEIAGKSYNLPLHSEVLMKNEDYLYVNRIDFKKYRKFGVESSIHYGSQQ